MLAKFPRSVKSFYEEVTAKMLAKFALSVRSFYEEITARMLAKFPFNDQTLKSLGYLNPERRLEISVEAVLQLSDKLFRDFQLSPASDLPSFTQGKTPLDVFWVNMNRVSTPLKKPRFPNLAKLSMAALSLPHSNADPERCFSILRKIQTDHRGNVCGKTVSSLISCKINAKCDCFELRPSNELCIAAK
ncbi:hypothetical protein ACJMK2_013177 [Sinanodonta woodiana]|uniref:HAT C-terminal dimerisation domain-containing protein n=1 Tax=Sinanodonta woodiana TaxID=1069815 RepID=A0ABD3UZZ4_SINWO